MKNTEQNTEQKIFLSALRSISIYTRISFVTRRRETEDISEIPYEKITTSKHYWRLEHVFRLKTEILNKNERQTGWDRSFCWYHRASKDLRLFFPSDIWNILKKNEINRYQWTSWGKSKLIRVSFLINSTFSSPKKLENFSFDYFSTCTKCRNSFPAGSRTFRRLSFYFLQIFLFFRYHRVRW